MYLIQGKGGAAGYSGKHEILMTAVINQVSDLDPAELLMVADIVEGIEMARNFSNRQNSTAI